MKANPIVERQIEEILAIEFVKYDRVENVQLQMVSYHIKSSMGNALFERLNRLSVKFFFDGKILVVY